MLNLNDLHLFVSAVENGGFSQAARKLRKPKSTVSKRVAELEKELGATLIERTSRRFALTDLGAEFYDHARAALLEAESAEHVVQRRLVEPSGRVRLTTSVPTAQFYLAELLPALARKYPRLRLELIVTDRFLDLVEDGIDIAVRSHFAPLPDSTLIQKRLAIDPVLLVAAATYISAHQTLRRPEDLRDHEGLLTSPQATWMLRSPGKAPVHVAPKPRMIADESVVLLNAARDGLGIVCLPATICRDDLAARRLRHVLPQWTAGSVTTTLLSPPRRGTLPSVRAVIEFLTARLNG